MRALPLMLAFLMMAPLGAAGAPERVLEFVIGGPLVGAGIQHVPVESFVLPDWYVSAFVAIESRRTINGGVFALDDLMLWSPTGEGSPIGNGGGAGFYTCLDVVCEDSWADPERSHTLPNGDGEWTIEYRGATTAEYTLGVYAFR